MSHRRALLAVAALWSGLAACSSADERVSAEWQAGGATITATWEPDGDEVRVRIEPLEDGFHLYSPHLVPEEHDGLGIPTELRVQGGWTATGPPVAQQPEVDVVIEELDVRLPAFEDGPVEFIVPVVRVDDRPADLVLTFGLCSSSKCLKPLRDQHFELPAPPTED